VTKGNILLIHRKSFTYIKELGIDDFFGEFAFFSGSERKTSAKSKNFTETLTLKKVRFNESLEEYVEAF
jgi:CRP-like cAMP-binding protein